MTCVGVESLNVCFCQVQDDGVWLYAYVINRCPCKIKETNRLINPSRKEPPLEEFSMWGGVPREWRFSGDAEELLSSSPLP